MATKTTEFWELYKHPLWQEKRLRIMERAGFACELCNGKEVTLNVHHIYYERGKKPWEYADNLLRCLCERCHEYSHEKMNLLRELAGSLDVYNFERLLGYAVGMRLYEDGQTWDQEYHEETTICSESANCITTGITDAWDMEYERLRVEIKKQPITSGLIYEIRILQNRDEMTEIWAKYPLDRFDNGGGI